VALKNLLSNYKARVEALSPLLNERARRLFVASEARAAGRGGVTAVSNATGVACSTINCGLAELPGAEPQPASCIRRPGGGRKQKAETERWPALSRHCFGFYK